MANNRENNVKTYLLLSLFYFRVTILSRLDNLFLLRQKHRLNLAPVGEAAKSRGYVLELN